MNYTASITDFFKSPKWMMNLLLAAVCGLIPVVGPMVVLGWLIGGFWGRTEEAYETFPDFNFDRFGKYLERGLWPSLVSLVAGVVCVPVFVILMFIAMFMIGGVASGHGHESSGGLVAIMMLFVGCLVVLLLMIVMFVLTPLMLRACLTQDFASAFNFAYLKRFISLTKSELLISILFMGGAGVVLMIVCLVPCLGYLCILAAIPPLYFAWTHLSKQIYKLYLSRGGEAVPLSPKLSDVPPAMPSA